MNIWVKSIAAGTALAAAVFFLSGKLNEKKRKKYSLEYIIEAKPDKGSALPFSISKIVKVLEERLQAEDYKYKIEKHSDTTIHVSLTGIGDTLNPGAVFTSNGRVQFRELYNIIEVKEMLMAAIEIMQETNTVLLKKKKDSEKKDSVSKKTGGLAENLDHTDEQELITPPSLIEFSPTFQSPTGSLDYPADIGRVKLKDTATVRLILNAEKVRLKAPVDMKICFGNADKDLKKGQKHGDQLVSLYFLKTLGSLDKAVLENEDISDATQNFDQAGHVEIRLQFNESGTRKWAIMTEQNIGRSIAIIINGTVKSAPTVLSSIENGSASITGSYSMGEAHEISVGLKSSKLPATLNIISSVVKQEKSTGEICKMLLVTLIPFIVFTILAFFVFKTLKAT